MRFITRFLPKTLEGSLRLSGGLVFFGFLTAIPTLFWTHALSFMAFTGISGVLIGAGIVLYLIALLRFVLHPEADAPGNHRPAVEGPGAVADDRDH